MNIPLPTRSTVRLAYAIAIAVDALQLVLGPFGWTFADEVLDVIAMALLWRLLGFHPLLLPSFVIELLPVADVLPTWTGCVALVIALRRRTAMTRPPSNGPVIDV